jgi:hypothetical protein
MKLKEERLLDVDSNFEENEIEIEVAKEEANKLFSILLENYKNSRASFIREVTSNAWDAHKEINSSEPVIVKLHREGNENYISFVDKGVGMSEKFIYKTFSKLLKSTKTDSNEQIGGWGIGSKSPLAYREQFFLSTVKDGYKNEYIIYREGTEMPKILPTLTNEPTEEQNGTTVKVQLLDITHVDKYYSWRSIHEGEHIANTVVKELAYFDNVILDFDYKIAKKYDYENYNNSKIVEGEYFKFRAEAQYDKEIHIVLGKVAYPIDWKEISEIDREFINIPIAVKFEIGELQVNMTREMIRYSDESKKLITERVNAAINEIKTLFDKQNLYEDFIKWGEAFSKFKKRNAFLHFELENNRFATLDLSPIIKKLNAPKYIKLAHLPIEIKNDNPHWFIYFKNALNNRRETKDTSVTIRTYVSNNYTQKIFYNRSGELSKVFKQYVSNCYFLKVTKIKFKKDLREWEENLGLSVNQINKSKIIWEYRKVIKEEVVKVLKAIDYKTFEIPKEWFEEQKLEKREKIKKIVVDGITEVKDVESGDRITIRMNELSKFTGIVIVGFMEDRENLKKLLRVFEQSKFATVNYQRVYKGRDYEYKNVPNLNKKQIKIYQISKNVIPLFNKLPYKVYHISQIMEMKPIKRFITCQEIINNVHVTDTVNVFKYNEYIDKVIKEILEYKEGGLTRAGDILREVINAYTLNPEKAIELAIDPVIKSKLDKVNEYFKDVELLSYLRTVDDKNIKFVINYLKANKKKVNLQFYQFTKREESKKANKIESFKCISINPPDLKNYSPYPIKINSHEEPTQKMAV